MRVSTVVSNSTCYYKSTRARESTYVRGCKSKYPASQRIVGKKTAKLSKLCVAVIRSKVDTKWGVCVCCPNVKVLSVYRYTVILIGLGSMSEVR